MFRRLDIANLIPPRYTSTGTILELGGGSPRVSTRLRASVGPVNAGREGVTVRLLQVGDLKHNLEQHGMTSFTEKGSKAIMEQGAFLSLCSHGMAVAVNKDELSIVVAGTAFQLCLIGMHYRSSTSRLGDLKVYFKDTHSAGLTNLNAPTNHRFCVIMNAIIASLDEDKKLAQRYSDEPIHENLAECYTSYIHEGLPLSDDLKRHCPALVRYSKHMVILAIATHRMLGGNFKQDSESSFLDTLDSKDTGFGSPSMLDKCIIEYYDKVASVFDNRPLGYEDADGYVRGSQRPRDPTLSPALAAFLAWLEANGTKTKDSPGATATRLKELYDKYLSTPMPSANENHITPPRNDAVKTQQAQQAVQRPVDPAHEAAKKALNDFYAAHDIKGEPKNQLWAALCKKRLTCRTGAPFDEAKVRECCTELNIQLKD